MHETSDAGGTRAVGAREAVNEDAIALRGLVFHKVKERLEELEGRSAHLRTPKAYGKFEVAE